MFVEINGKYLNTHYISSMKKTTEEVDWQTKYLIIYTLVNGANIKQEFSSQAEADEKYEEVEKSGGGGSGPSTNVYVYRGSCLFADLPSSGNTAGDVYNIEDDFELGGKTYYAGTNVAWKGDDWDPLAGTIDTSIFETKSNKTNTINSESTNEQYAGAATLYSELQKASKNDFVISNTINIDELEVGKVYFCADGPLNNKITFKISSGRSGSANFPECTLYFKVLQHSTDAQYIPELFQPYSRVKPLVQIVSISKNAESTGYISGRLESYYIVMYEDGSLSAYGRGAGFSEVYMITKFTQRLYGKKMFEVIPEVSSYSVPTKDVQLIPKKYVDDQIIASAVQYTTMPIAAQTNLGKVIQFVGTTDSTYTNGYYYQCVSDGGQEQTYSWQRIDVQPAPDMSNYYTKDEVDALFEEKLGDIETIVDAILDGSANAENMEF